MKGAITLPETSKTRKLSGLLISKQFELNLLRRVEIPVSVRRLKQRPSKPKPLPFTDEQISLRAYEIWQRREQQGTPSENWQAAIVELQRERSLVWKLHQLILLFNQLILLFKLLIRFLKLLGRSPVNVICLLRLAVTAETPSAALDVVKVVISIFSVLATIFAGVGLYLTYQNAQADRQLNTERLITDRFTKAVEHLGNQDIHVRLGGIYSLERIAKDSSKDHWAVVEVLTAYIRNKSSLPEGRLDIPKQKRKSLPKAVVDVRAATTVIGMREAKNKLHRK